MLSKVSGKKPPIGVRLIGIIHISFGLLFIGFAAIAVSGCIIGILTLAGGLVLDSFFAVYSLPGVGGLLGISTIVSGENIYGDSETLLRFFVINVGLFIVGSIYVEIGNALFKGIGWARVAVLIFMSIKLVAGGIIAIEAPYLLVLVAIDFFMLDYFRKPHVKEYFAGSPIENSFKRFTQRLKKSRSRGCYNRKRRRWKKLLSQRNLGHGKGFKSKRKVTSSYCYAYRNIVCRIFNLVFGDLS